MDNQDIAKLKAKYRLELLVALLVLILASGGVAEYRRFNAPLSSAVIIVDAGAGVAKADILEPSSNTNQPIKAPDSSLNPPKAKDVALPVEQPINTASQNSVELTQKLLPQNDTASEISETTVQTEQKLQKSVAETNDALQSFLGYLQNSQQKLDEVKLPAFRLDDIHEKVITSSNEKKTEPQFKQDVIEIYDSEKGVVDVQSTNAAPARENLASQENNEVNEEKKQNVAPVEKTTPQTEQQAKSVEQPSQIEQKSQSNNQTSQSDNKIQQNEKAAQVINSPAQNENNAELKVVEPKPQSVEVAIEEKMVSENIDDNSASANAPVNMMEKIAPTDNQAQDVKNNSAKTEELNENPAPADNVIKDESQVSTSQKSETTSSVSSSKTDVKSAQEKVGAKTSDIKSQQVQKTSSSDIEDKALKTKRANEALENLFKKIALPEKQIIVVDPNSVKPTSLNKSESGENISNSNQPIENNKENNNPSTGEVNNNGAVDMMKAIVSRK